MTELEERILREDAAHDQADFKKKFIAYTKHRLRVKKHASVVHDPYPALTLYDTLSWWDRFFMSRPPTTPHQAWADGFEFAWQLIEEELKEKG